MVLGPGGAWKCLTIGDMERGYRDDAQVDEVQQTLDSSRVLSPVQERKLIVKVALCRGHSLVVNFRVKEFIQLCSNPD
jgi:hypothetical protein